MKNKRKGILTKGKRVSKKRKRTTFLSIKTKIIALFITTLFIGVIAVLFSVIPKTSRMIMDSTHAVMQESVNSMGQVLDRTYTDLSYSLESFSNSGTISSYLSGMVLNPANPKKEIAKYMSDYPTMSNCSIVNSAGEILLSTDPSLIGMDLSESSFIKDTVELKKTIYTPPVPSLTGAGTMLAFTAPVRSLDQIVGLVLITADIPSIFAPLQTAQVPDTTSSYAYLLNSDGTVLFHPKESLIGTMMKNVANNTSLTEPERYSAQYDSDITGHSVVLSVEKEELLAPLKSMIISCIIISILIALLCALICYLFANTITRPIKKITSVIRKTGELDLVTDDSYEQLKNKKDETGIMAGAIHHMRAAMWDVVMKLNDTSTLLQESAQSLGDATDHVNQCALDNSATADQLAGSMLQTAASANSISEQIEQADNHTVVIASKVKESALLSNSLNSKSRQLKECAEQSSDITKELYEQVKEKTTRSIEQAESIKQITTFANSIKKMAAQTSLLSLNASIEAARAGSAGLGFSVVATEISKLASQSSDTVEDITAAVLQVENCVLDMANDLKTILDFLDTNVLGDYQNFLNLSTEYNRDVDQLDASMQETSQTISNLVANMRNIAASISEITTVVKESSDSITCVAEKNKDIVLLIEEVHATARQNTVYADTLNQLVDKFTL